LLKLFRLRRSKRVPDKAVGVLDASTVYGAGRWYFGDHANATWQYAGQYQAEEDRLLFCDFLHSILFYDRPVFDVSSVRELAREIERIFNEINDHAGYEHLSADLLASADNLRPVINVVCKLLHCRHQVRWRGRCS